MYLELPECFKLISFVLDCPPIFELIICPDQMDLEVSI